MAATAAPQLEMARAELDALFGSSPAGDIPAGRGTGTVVVASGTPLARPLAAAARLLLWQGKVFRPGTHDLENLLTPFGVRAVRAEVYQGDSVFDGRPCIVLDYSKTSKAAGSIRDEIRQIGPHEYLGLVFRGSRQLGIHFLLSFAHPDGALP